jgi:hypothetical protein
VVTGGSSKKVVEVADSCMVTKYIITIYRFYHRHSLSTGMRYQSNAMHTVREHRRERRSYSLLVSGVDSKKSKQRSIRHLILVQAVDPAVGSCTRYTWRGQRRR